MTDLKSSIMPAYLKRRLRGNLIIACKYLYRKNVLGGKGLFNAEKKGITRTKAYKLKPEKFKSETRQFFFYKRR